jgi:hypothetical protein
VAYVVETTVLVEVTTRPIDTKSFVMMTVDVFTLPVTVTLHGNKSAVNFAPLSQQADLARD